MREGGGGRREGGSEGVSEGGREEGGREGGREERGGEGGVNLFTSLLNKPCLGRVLTQICLECEHPQPG